MGVVCCCFEPRSVLVHGKRRVRRLFWRVRAGIKRKVKARSSKKNFNYDPLSYSLNFDNGNFELFCSTQLKENKGLVEVEKMSNNTQHVHDEYQLEGHHLFLFCYILFLIYL
ncbi:hypothetical protein Lalb_Chr21g0307091 [Lupinus albus]|uniref:Uncharacterized protein n=1 Tax=Lupinus albus TaxID=3870 RepID=A0A6A4N4L2_LUPAL|nr:hypothetical protein Lalb_Chr21g0307091 [Lupinus albus]